MSSPQFHGQPAEVEAWFRGRLPDEWTEPGLATVTTDREEIHVVLALDVPEDESLPETSSEDTALPGTSAPDTAAPDTAAAQTRDHDVRRAAMVAGRIAAFRDRTKNERIRIAAEAEHRFDRKVAWGVRVDDSTTLFTHLAVPVMTRLRQPERLVLDTLVAAGVARSRSDALSWCVRLVGRHTEDWLADLRAAMADVERLRAAGPDVD